MCNKDEIISALYGERSFREAAKRIAPNDWEDLMSEAILKILSIKDLCSIKNPVGYGIVTMHKLWAEERNVFRKVYYPEKEVHTIRDVPDINDEPVINVNKYDVLRFLIKEKQGKDFSYLPCLYWIYITRGRCNYRETARILGINHQTITTQIRDYKKRIIDYFEN